METNELASSSAAKSAGKRKDRGEPVAPADAGGSASPTPKESPKAPRKKKKEKGVSNL